MLIIMMWAAELNNERSALLFLLLFRRIAHMCIFRVEHVMKRFSILMVRLHGNS